MKRYFHGIRFKTIIVMLFITLLSTVMIAGWLYNKSAQVLKEEMEYSQMIRIESTSKFVRLILDDIDTIATNILFDKDLQKAACAPADSVTPFENYKNSSLVQEKLRKLKNVNEKIESIFLYDQINDRIFSTEFYGYISAPQMDSMGWSSVRDLACSPVEWNIIRDGSVSGNKILISNKKHQNRGNTTQFTFYINVDQRQFNQMLKDMKGSINSLSYMMDDKRQPLAFSEALSDEFFEGVNQQITDIGQEKEIQIGRERYLAVSQNMKEVGWSFISLVPVSEVYGKLSRIRQLLFWIGIVTILIILFFGFYMNRLIYVPMNKLIETMNQNRTGGPVTCGVAGQKDEFGEIAANFNELIIQQYDLNRKLIQQEGLTKNAEIRFLQSQINPHFLYNILDTIHWMARMGENEAVEKTTLALSRFYRSSLNNGREIIPLKESLQMVLSYFEIQKVRFHNRIELIVEIEESIEGVLVPKRIFQPLMENAINHGIAGCERRGILMISGVDLGEEVKLIVEDNGVGLPEESVDKINREIEAGDFDTPGNYALKNLNSQIKILYGPEYGLKLESSPGRGTTVTVTISKKLQMKEEV